MTESSPGDQVRDYITLNSISIVRYGVKQHIGWLQPVLRDVDEKQQRIQCRRLLMLAVPVILYFDG